MSNTTKNIFGLLPDDILKCIINNIGIHYAYYFLISCKDIWSIRKELPKISYNISNYCTNIQSIQWALNNGCPPSLLSKEEIYMIVAKSGDLKNLKSILTFKWLLNHIPYAKSKVYGGIHPMLKEYTRTDFAKLYGIVAFNGHLEIIKWFFEFQYNEDYSWYMPEIMGIAARNGHLEIIKWFLEICDNYKEYRDRIKICTIAYDAARYGHLKIVKYCWEKVFLLNGMTKVLKEIERSCTEIAAFKSHSHIIEWLLNNGCPLYKDVSTYAARSSNFTIFKWCYDKGYPLSCDSANHSGNLEIFKFHYDKNIQCSCNYYYCNQCGNVNENYENIEIIDWINIHGLPFSLRKKSSYGI